MSVLLADDGLIAQWFRASTFSVRVSLGRRFDSGRTLMCQISLNFNFFNYEKSDKAKTAVMLNIN